MRHRVPSSGVTGGIGAGKSTARARSAELGAATSCRPTSWSTPLEPSRIIGRRCACTSAATSSTASESTGPRWPPRVHRTRPSAPGWRDCSGRWSADRDRHVPGRARRHRSRRRSPAWSRCRCCSSPAPTAASTHIAVVADDRLRAARTAERRQDDLAAREQRQLSQQEKADASDVRRRQRRNRGRAGTPARRDRRRDRRVTRTRPRRRGRVRRRIARPAGRRRAARARGIELVPLVNRVVREFDLPAALHVDHPRRRRATSSSTRRWSRRSSTPRAKFDARTSSAGAVGLMQVLPSTARYIAHLSAAPRSGSPTSPSPGQHRCTAATTCASCSTSTTATRRWPSPPTTPERRTSTPGSPPSALAASRSRSTRSRSPETRDYVAKVLSAGDARLSPAYVRALTALRLARRSRSEYLHGVPTPSTSIPCSPRRRPAPGDRQPGRRAITPATATTLCSASPARARR